MSFAKLKRTKEEGRGRRWNIIIFHFPLLANVDKTKGRRLKKIILMYNSDFGYSGFKHKFEMFSKNHKIIIEKRKKYLSNLIGCNTK